MILPDQTAWQQMMKEREQEEAEKKRRLAAKRTPKPPSRRTNSRSSPMPFVSPMALATGMASIMPARQASHLQGMADDIMAAMSKENYSRVAQAREMRRMMNERAADREKMQHEKDMLLMRLRAMRGE